MNGGEKVKLLATDFPRKLYYVLKDFTNYIYWFKTKQPTNTVSASRPGLPCIPIPLWQGLFFLKAISF